MSSKNQKSGTPSTWTQKALASNLAGPAAAELLEFLELLLGPVDATGAREVLRRLTGSLGLKHWCLQVRPGFETLVPPVDWATPMSLHSGMGIWPEKKAQTFSLALFSLFSQNSKPFCTWTSERSALRRQLAAKAQGAAAQDREQLSSYLLLLDSYQAKVGFTLTLEQPPWLVQFHLMGADPPQSALQRIEALLSLLGPGLVRTGIGLYQKHHQDRLTQRQKQVLEVLLWGDTRPEAASRLGVSEDTVAFHLKRAFANLGASSLPKALALALSLGLIRLAPPPDNG